MKKGQFHWEHTLPLESNRRFIPFNKTAAHRTADGDVHTWIYTDWKRISVDAWQRIGACTCGLKKKERKPNNNAHIYMAGVYIDGQWHPYKTQKDGKIVTRHLNAIPCIKKETPPEEQRISRAP